MEYIDACIFKSYFKPCGADKYEIHMFSPSMRGISSLETLKKYLELIYPALKKKDYFVSVIDEEGDELCLKNNEEFCFFFQNLLENGRLNLKKMCKIYIKEEKKDRGVGYNPVIHEGVVCDECDSEIKGFRYKCLECSNYDLCEECEGMHHHSEHLMVRLGMTSPCSVILRKKNRDDYRTFLLSVPVNDADEGRFDCRKRKGKDKHRRHSGRGEKRENDSEGSDRECKKRINRMDFPDYMNLFNNFIQKYDKFINPSVTTHEDDGAGEVAGVRSCRDTIAQLASAYCNSVFDHYDAFFNGNSSTETTKEKQGNKTDSEEKTETLKNENDGVKAEGNDSTNFEDVVKRFSSQTISDEKESPATSQGNVSNANGDYQPEPEKQNLSKEEKRIGNYMGQKLSSEVTLGLLGMLSMGFSFEDERILPLLIEHKGDITKVIDALYKN